MQNKKKSIWAFNLVFTNNDSILTSNHANITNTLKQASKEEISKTTQRESSF